MFSRVQPSAKSNPRKRQKISHSSSSEDEGAENTNPAVTAAESNMSQPTRSADHALDGACQHDQALKRLEPDLEAMRQLITCKVCQRFLSEPYSLTCGHTYCYECLDAWLVDQQKRSCPGCRAVINQQPVPSYVIREMTGIFTSRAELMPDGETLEEHAEFAREAAEKVSRDRENMDPRTGGLFRGTFNGQGNARPMALRDPGDNVDRCPSCHWEIEHGVCSGCGLHVGEDDEDAEDSDGQTFSSDSELDHDLENELEGDQGFPDPWGDPASYDENDFVDEMGNVPPEADLEQLFGAYPAADGGSSPIVDGVEYIRPRRRGLWGQNSESVEESDEDSEEMHGFIDDDEELGSDSEVGSSEDDGQDEEAEGEGQLRAPRRLHRRAPIVVDSDHERASATNDQSAINLVSDDSDDDEEGPIARGSKRTNPSRRERRHQAAAFSSEEDVSGSDTNSENSSNGVSDSDGAGDSSGIDDAATGMLQTSAFSPLQDGASESGYDNHDPDHDHDHDHDDDEDDEHEYGGGADLGAYSNSLNFYTGQYGDDDEGEEDDADEGRDATAGSACTPPVLPNPFTDSSRLVPTTITRVETPTDDRSAQPDPSHRLAKRQRRRQRHAERSVAVANRAGSPSRRAPERRVPQPGHPVQLENTLERINGQQRGIRDRASRRESSNLRRAA